MIKYICDKCKRIFDDKIFDCKLISNKALKYTISYNLCEDCVNKICDFIKESDKNVY